MQGSVEVAYSVIANDGSSVEAETKEIIIDILKEEAENNTLLVDGLTGIKIFDMPDDGSVNSRNGVGSLQKGPDEKGTENSNTTGNIIPLVAGISGGVVIVIAAALFIGKRRKLSTKRKENGDNILPLQNQRSDESIVSSTDKSVLNGDLTNCSISDESSCASEPLRNNEAYDDIEISHMENDYISDTDDTVDL